MVVEQLERPAAARRDKPPIAAKLDYLCSDADFVRLRDPVSHAPDRECLKSVPSRDVAPLEALVVARTSELLIHSQAIRLSVHEVFDHQTILVAVVQLEDVIVIHAAAAESCRDRTAARIGVDDVLHPTRLKLEM